MNKSSISFYIASPEALSLETHDFKNITAYESLKNLIQNLPQENPGKIHFYEIKNALIDDPWRCSDTGCIEGDLWKGEIVTEVKCLFEKDEFPDDTAPIWLIAKYLNDIDDSEKSKNIRIKYLKHFEKHSGIVATIIEHLSPKDLSNEMLITLATSDHYNVRFGLLNMKNANTLPQHILRILSHDHDPNIEVKAAKLRSENNISPCFYPWGDKS